jgi:hypothetical protein
MLNSKNKEKNEREAKIRMKLKQGLKRSRINSSKYQSRKNTKEE